MGITRERPRYSGIFLFIVGRQLGRVGERRSPGNLEIGTQPASISDAKGKELLTGGASDNVRFTPESRHKRRVRLMSANDPKRTSRAMR